MSSIFGQGPSDYLNFIGPRVPTVFFSDSTGPCCHTTPDQADIVDFGKLTQQAEVAYHVARELADTPHPPAFVDDAPIADYTDAVQLPHVINAGFVDLEHTDRNRSAASCCSGAPTSSASSPKGQPSSTAPTSPGC